MGKMPYKRIVQAAGLSLGGLGNLLRNRFPGKKPRAGGRTKFKKGRSLKSKRNQKRPQSFTSTMTKKKRTVRKVLSGHNDMSTHHFPLYPAGPGIVDGDKIHVASANYRLDLLNMSNIPADVEILYLVSNRDQAQSPTAAWNLCIEEEQLNQVTPVAAATDSTFTGGVGFRQQDNVGNHPMQYANFKKYWKVIGQYKVVLQPGNQHSMKSRIHWHKTFTRKVLNAYDPDITYLKGISVMPMIIANGGLVGIISEAASTNPSKEVVNGPVKLGWKQELEYIFKALPVQRLKTQRVFEGLMEPTIPSVYTLKIIDDQDDVTIVEES